MYLQNLVAEEVGNDAGKSGHDHSNHCSWLGSCEEDDDASGATGTTEQNCRYRKAKLFTTANPRNALDPDEIPDDFLNTLITIRNSLRRLRSYYAALRQCPKPLDLSGCGNWQSDKDDEAKALKALGKSDLRKVLAQHGAGVIEVLSSFLFSLTDGDVSDPMVCWCDDSAVSMLVR
jgi:hypothetical protein